MSTGDGGAEVEDRYVHSRVQGIATQATLAESMEVLLGMVTPHTRVQKEIQSHQLLCRSLSGSQTGALHSCCASYLVGQASDLGSQ